MTDTTDTTTGALLERVVLEVHGGGDVVSVARDGVVHAVIVEGAGVAAAAAYTAAGMILVVNATSAQARAAAALHTITAAARVREGELAVAVAFGVTDLEEERAGYGCERHQYRPDYMQCPRCADERTDASRVVGAVEVPEQRPASVNDVLATDPVGYARAAAIALGVEVGPAVDLSDVVPGVDTVWLVVGGTRPRGELVAAPFVAVATRDEAAAWTAAADLVGKGGARVDALPLL